MVKDRLHDPAFPLAQIPADLLILQGGGALGAFECGVVRALEEEQVFPDIVGGVSIGALNGAIVASNPKHATKALEAFWSDLAVSVPFPLPAETSRTLTSMSILMFGVPSFFKPRWLPPFSDPLTPPAQWLSFYDTAPIRKLISTYVDFPALKKSGPPSYWRRQCRHGGTGGVRQLRRRPHTGPCPGQRQPATGFPVDGNRREGLLGRRYHQQFPPRYRRRPLWSGWQASVHRGFVCRTA